MRSLLVALALAASPAWCAVPRVGRFEMFEASFAAAGNPANPYTGTVAEAVLARPGGGEWRIPLFWYGGREWKMRVSPDVEGSWRFSVRSADRGLNGRTGRFECVASSRAGGLAASGAHFARQNGTRVWFLGDTAWGYFSDSPEDNHHRAQAEHYARRRAAGGFNAIHAMLMSEQGVGNQAGLPFDDMRAERLNPAYWREVDERLAFANRLGLTVGLALAWGDKRGKEPFAWGRFPSPEARRRYARYIGARYSAFDVYFLVAGEWHAEINKRGGDPEAVFADFVAIGDALAAADPHRRLTAIHPMFRHGSVREFSGAKWMAFGDYQQNYDELHARALVSTRLGKPVVNSEYGYFLRDQDGDGVPDKSNSYSASDMRFATWDIVMAGAYVVTGFGTTYFAGHRDPGPFDPDAAKNREWERQAANVRKFFESLEYWKLIPASELLECAEPRSGDRPAAPGDSVRPPARTWWAMADPGSTYVIYVRGARAEVTLAFDARPRRYRVRQFDPRSGEFTGQGVTDGKGVFRYRPPDEQDWAVVLDSPGASPAAAAAPGLRFSHAVVDPDGPKDVWLKTTGDLNGDGRPDLVAGGIGGGGLVWYQNPGWTRHVISSSGSFSTDGEVADIDKDGKPDVVAVMQKQIAWFRGPDWAPHKVADAAAHDVEVADFDGDGRLDLVARDQGAFGGKGHTLYFYLQQTPGVWTARTQAIPDGEGLLVADVNRDRRPDVIVGRTWLENPGGKPVWPWPAHEFAPGWTHPHAYIAAADLSGSGRLDIALAPSEKQGSRYRISWFEAPRDPKRGVWREHVLEDGVETTHHFIGAGDFDGDGRPDIATARMHQSSDPEVAIYLNRGRTAPWQKVVVARTSSHSMRVADLNGDGLADLYGANWRGNVVEVWMTVR